MPIYSYKCDKCGAVKDQYNSIANRKNGPDCCESMKLLIKPTQLAPVLGGGDFPGYQCPVTDKYVTSRRQRRNIMAEHNLVEKGDSGRGKQASGL
jgi:putative FmdB family regulatory protein